MSARSSILVASAIATIALVSAAFAGILLAPVGHAAASPQGPAPAIGLRAGSASSPTALVGVHALAAPGPAAEARLQAKIQAAHVDLQKIYPPNLLYAPTLKNGMIVGPSYPQAPEPAGLADYGVLNASGTPSSYTIDTTSYRASLNLNSVSPYYLADGVPEGFTSQLNVVLQNVTVLGNSSHNFWTQNVLFYDAYSSQLFVENNIWNFSSPSAPQPYSTFVTNVSGFTNGTDDPSIGYYAAGTPTFTGVTTPFSIIFYINASTRVLSGTAYTEVDFAFDLLNGTGVQVMSDQYDRVLFNNYGGGSTIPQAHFHIDGTNITPTGFIPYDAEIMLGGPGGGSTATFQGLSATMTLQHWDASAGKYVNEPAVWSSGSETGETAVGVAEYYDSSHVVHLSGGPEFIQPFWNSSPAAKAGAATLTGTIHPSNSWAFVDWGSSYSVATSAWAPLPASGTYTWDLTAGTYVVKLMESDFDAQTSTAMALSPTAPTYYNVSLTHDASAGVYTPLYAWDNAQLAAISSSGTGTAANPYILVNNEIGPLASEFATFNDYAFTSYAGISLVNTTAYVEIANPAPFTVDYWGHYYSFALYYSIPVTDSLPIWLFETTHVSILGGTVSGWFSANQNGFPYANLLIWNSTSILVSGVTFEVSTNAIFTYGGMDNTFTGNTFENDLISANLMTPSGYFFLGPYGPYPSSLGPTGIIENEGGDTLWNNYFDTSVTAFESNANVYDDLYASVPATFTNNWNLSGAIPVSSSTVFTVNGVGLSGSVTGNASVCGNWWWNNVSGAALPYDNPYPAEVPYYTGTGNIITGGDYCPAGPTTFTVQVGESGLPAGTLWSVDVSPAPSVTLPYGGTDYEFGTSANYSLPAGSYEAVFSPIADYTLAPQTYDFNVLSSGLILSATGYVPSVTALYTPENGTVVFAETGLPTGDSWSVDLNGSTLSGTNASLNASLAFGTYAYTVGAVSGYTASPSSGNASVTAGNLTSVNIVFSPTNGTLAGSVTPASALLWIDGVAASLTDGAFSQSVSAGVHSVEATATGYYPYFNNVSVSSGTTTELMIVLNPITPPVGADGTLTLQVTPTSASAWVDGVAVSLTDGTYSASVTPGVHSLEITASGYYPYFNNVTVTSQLTTTVPVTLDPVTPPVGADGTLSLSVTPSSATARVDGSVVSLTEGQYTAPVVPGIHAIEVTEANYYPYFNNVTVVSSLTTDLSITLNPVTATSGQTGTLAITVTPTSASAWVDGSPVSLNTTTGAYSATLSTGVPHSIEVSDSGYYAYFNNITVVADTTTHVAVALNPVTPPAGPDGTLTLTVAPSSASVWVDGSPVSLSDGSYSASVTPGVHAIEVTASGYFAYFNNVTVKSGAVSTVSVSLNSASTSTSGNGGVGSTGWILVGVLAALAVIFLITTLLFMGRSRGGSGGTKSETDSSSPASGSSSESPEPKS
jgi:thermopsin